MEKMDKLMEPQQLSEEIIGKLGNDYIRRYSLKQQLSSGQFLSDTNRLIAQLELYTRTIKQVRQLTATFNPSLDEKMFETMLKVMQFLARHVEKLELRGPKPSESRPGLESICKQCSSNLNAKKIESVRRQIFEYLPMFGKEELEQQQQNRYSEQQTIYLLGHEETVKKMGQLQRNLHEKQVGLMRCIEEFDDFRTNLLIGLPKHSLDRGLEDRFNTKDYVFKLAMYFSNNLKSIEEKISHLKFICKKTVDAQTQCHFKQNNEDEHLKSIIAEYKATGLKNQLQLRKLNDIRNRLEDNAKIYCVQIKVLNTKLEHVEEENQALRHEVFVEKLKNKGKDAELKRLEVKEQPRHSTHSPTQPESSLDDISIANQVLSQIHKRRSQIEQSGAKMEEALPILKSTFKKALDHFISQRTSSNFDRKRILQLDSRDQDNNVGKQAKKQKKPSKALLSGDVNKSDNSKIQSSFTRRNPKHFLKIAHNQVSYKITGNKRLTSRNYTYTDDKNSISGDNTQNDSRFLYKKSTLQTEGNLKKRPLHVKLSSLSSEVKDSIGYENKSQLQIQYGIYHPQQCQGQNSRDLQDLSQHFGQRQFSHLLAKLQKNKTLKQKGSLRRRKNESLTTLGKIDSKRQSMNTLIQVKKMPHKTLGPQVLQNFFHPNSQSAISSPNSSEIQTLKGGSIEVHGVSTMRQHNKENKEQDHNRIEVEEDRHAKIKVIFNHLKSVGNSVSDSEEKDARKRNAKKDAMNLEELSYVTAFFTLMAQAHLTNEPLYSQIKICAFEAGKKDSLHSAQHQQAMIKDSIRDIIIGHRRCTKSRQLCGHLSKFLIQFNQCLQA